MPILLHATACYCVNQQYLKYKKVTVCLPFLPPSAGTTCLVALLSDRELTVANVGDSRGVLCDKDGNAVALSHDHKPYQLKERKRIKRAGREEDFSVLPSSGYS